MLGIESPSCPYVLEHFTTLEVLHHHHHLHLLQSVALVDAYDVGVVQQLQVLNLAEHDVYLVR